MRKLSLALLLTLLLPIAAWAQVPGGSVVAITPLATGNCVIGAGSVKVKDSGIDCSGGPGAFMTRPADNATAGALQQLSTNAGAALLSLGGALTVAGTTTFSSITGSTQCLQVNTSGVVAGSGGACGGGGSGLTVGTTTIASGTTLGLLYDNAGVLGNLATANSGVLVTSASGVPSISSTITTTNPSLTAPYIFTSISSADALNNNFLLAQCGAVNGSGSRYDQSFSWGYNLTPCGRQNTSDLANGWVVESYYNPSGTPQTEIYNQYYGSDGTGRRPIFITIPLGTNSPAIALQGSSVNINSPDGNTTYWTFNNTTMTGTALQLTGSVQAASLSLTGSGTAATIVGNVLGSGDFRAGASNAFYWVGRAQIYSPADGKIELLNSNSTNFTALQFGGTTSSFPSIKRTATALNFRLADDSADAPITAGAAVFSGQITVASSTTGSGTSTFTNSPCSGLTTEQWVPISITGQSGTWYVPACQ